MIMNDLREGDKRIIHLLEVTATKYIIINFIKRNFQKYLV